MSGWSSIQTLVASLPISAFLGFGMSWVNCGSWKCPVTSAKYMSWLREGRPARYWARARSPRPPFSSAWQACPSPLRESGSSGRT
jgi:hypothetical protein